MTTHMGVEDVRFNRARQEIEDLIHLHCDTDAAQAILSRINGMSWSVEEVTPNHDLCERFVRKYDFFKSIYGAPGELATYTNSWRSAVRESDDERCARIMQSNRLPAAAVAQNASGAASESLPASASAHARARAYDESGTGEQSHVSSRSPLVRAPLPGRARTDSGAGEHAENATFRSHNGGLRVHGRDMGSTESTLTPLLRGQQHVQHEKHNAKLFVSHVNATRTHSSAPLDSPNCSVSKYVAQEPTECEIPWADEEDEDGEYHVNLDLLRSASRSSLSPSRGKSLSSGGIHQKDTFANVESKSDAVSVHSLTLPPSNRSTTVPSALSRCGSDGTHAVNIKWKDVEWRPTLVFHGTSRFNVHSIATTGFRMPKAGVGRNQFFGRGIYADMDPRVACLYADKWTPQVFVCLALPGRAAKVPSDRAIRGSNFDGYDCHQMASTFAFFDNAQILPLFVARGSRGGSGQSRSLCGKPLVRCVAVLVAILIATVVIFLI